MTTASTAAEAASMAATTSTAHRIAVAGCGGIANLWVQYALRRNDAVIVALVDVREESAQAMAERYGLTCPTFTNLQEAIEATGATLVLDVTIPASHYEICATAMRLGCDVFGEKPMAESIGQCNELVALAEQTGRSHAVMQNRRYEPGIRALRKLITDGTIGRTGYIGADFFIAPHFGGFRDAMEHPLLIDMAIHTFDQARFIIGADPVSVYCQSFNPAGSWYAGDAAAICIFEMSDGSVFCYRGSWCAEGAATSWEADWRITGEHGTAIWNGKDAPYAEIVAPDDPQDQFYRKHVRIDYDKPAMDSVFHDGCLDEMFASLAEQRPAETAGRDNRYSMAMVLGAVESARTGRKIDLADFIAGKIGG